MNCTRTEEKLITEMSSWEIIDCHEHFSPERVWAVEKVAGHLHMARENFARVFGARIDRGLMSFADAVHILKLWFWDNPLRVYDRITK